MKNQAIRTDLALEAREISLSPGENKIEGVSYETKSICGINCHILDVSSPKGEEALGKAMGHYRTLEIGSLLRRESENFSGAVHAIAQCVSEFVPSNCINTLVVGLGNRDITPDALGPLTAASTLVTRHLKKQLPEQFAAFSPVAVITPGVLGTSGIESADYVKFVCSNLKPDLVLVVDALAARSTDRLCRTIQITDTGISPGSGVGNARAEISKKSLGVPVVAIGIPTVVDVRTLLADFGNGEANPDSKGNSMIVTPREIDSEVACLSRLLGYGINIMLHKGITIEDVDMLVG